MPKLPASESHPIILVCVCVCVAIMLLVLSVHLITYFSNFSCPTAPKSLSNSVKSSSNTFKQTEAKSLSPPSSPLLKHHKHHAQQQSPQILSQVNYSNHTPPSIQKKHFSSFDASIWVRVSLLFSN